MVIRYRTFAFPITSAAMPLLRGRVIALRPAWTDKIPSAEIHRIAPAREMRNDVRLAVPARQTAGVMRSGELETAIAVNGGAPFGDPPATIGEAAQPLSYDRVGQRSARVSGALGLARRVGGDLRAGGLAFGFARPRALRVR